ncbi:transketolase [Candidatus Roizmanbacteria bacterium]|nr:transketolase [Candidatus Roizmanbacteria bacterium]
MENNTGLTNLAREIREDIIAAVVPNNSHHIGCSLSIVEILTYLYFKKLRIFPKEPKNPERDIFILSKGHAALALYCILQKKGFFKEKLLDTYDQDNSSFPEHASSGVPGVELSTGSLGHGLPVGVGFALSFKNDKKNNQVTVLMSDGELDEGSNWEAIMFAGQHRLDNLTIVIDLNGFQGYGETKKVIDLSPIGKKISEFGWNVYETDGHNFDELTKTFDGFEKNNRPNCIIAKTVKGKGVPYFEGKFEAHYMKLDQETKDKILSEL